MRPTSVLAVLAALAFAAPAVANMGGSSTPEPKQPAGSTEPGATMVTATPRQRAERDYGDAYNEIAKAKKDAAEKKDKNAAKRYQKALDRAQRAVETDSTYHEAWNLVGYASRRLGKHDQAVAAYQKCLAIRFDYAPAREYLGETYLEMKNVEKAIEQHAILEKLKATAEAATLMAAIDTYRVAHGGSPASIPAEAANNGPAAAPADSTTSKP